jgi:hypothetical protein
MVVAEGHCHPVRVWLDGLGVLLLDPKEPDISPV